MKTKLLLLLFISAFIAACANKNDKSQAETEGKPDMHTAQIALDYAGTYKGVLDLGTPDSVTVTLKENSYTVSTKAAQGEGSIRRTLGKYSWNEEGNTITLEGVEDYNRFFVAENALILLDKDGNKPTADQAESRTLRKE